MDCYLRGPLGLAAYKRRIIFFNLLSMTDRQLYRLCKKFGRRALEARRRFAGLLPEVLKRRLYEKKGFSSIYEFAARLTGLSREHVDTVLRLERKFDDMPELHCALVEGRISPNKLVRIASVATTDNQREMFEVVRDLSRRALDVFVKDYRNGIGIKNLGESLFGDDAENGKVNGLFEPLKAPNSLAGQTFEGQVGLSVKQNGRVAELNHDFEIMAKLLPEVKNKMKEMMDKGMDINKELLEFFEVSERKIAEEKIEVAGEKQARPTRNIPAKVKKILKKEYGVKCAKPGCAKWAENIHHIQKFALTKDNSPQNLQPLCAGHHELEHMDDEAVQRHKHVLRL